MADAAFDVIAVPVEDAGGDGNVFLEHLAVLELQAQLAVRRFLLGNQNDAAGVAVQAVDDTGAVVAVQVAELAEMKLQGVGQCAAPVPLGRVHDHVKRLVDDGQEFVLIKDVERDVFGEGRGMGGLSKLDADRVADAHLEAGLAGSVVDGNLPGVDGLLHERSAVIGAHHREILIQARAGHLVLDQELQGPVGIGRNAHWPTFSRTRRG